MAIPVNYLKTVVLVVEDTKWQCQAMLEVDGPNAGKYFGLAVNLDTLDTKMTHPMGRGLDSLNLVIHQVLVQVTGVANAGIDVKLSREFAQANGVKSTLA